MPPFLPGLDLAERFYREAVRPLLDARLPGLPHAAGLIGAGSEILGFDTEMSMDHDWGPRVQLFLDEEHIAPIDEALHDLPRAFLEFPTFIATDDGERHRIETTTVAAFLGEYLAFDLSRVIEPADWLTFPEHKLRTVTEGRVFHDEIGLDAVRSASPTIPTTSGGTNWPRRGSGSVRRSISSDARASLATNSARQLSQRAWYAISCDSPS